MHLRDAAPAGARLMDPVPATRRVRWPGWAAHAGAAAVLVAVFMLYLEPDFMFTLAQQLWACW